MLPALASSRHRPHLLLPCVLLGLLALVLGPVAAACPGDCSGQGSCNEATQVCSCDSGYYGQACELQCAPGCPATGCDGSTGTCSPCNVGYYGPACSTECPGGASNPCSGNGTCDAGTGQCLCDVGFWGAACEHSCSAGCVTSACRQADGVCACRTGYYAPQCDLECPGGAASPCSGHGNCSPSGQCSCPPGWWGSDCSNQCPGGAPWACSGNGVCLDGSSGSGECECLDGWYGAMCGETCSPGCDGVCDRSNGVCACKLGWWGARCQNQYLCSRPCGEHGTCAATDTCACDHGWAGDVCDRRSATEADSPLSSENLPISLAFAFLIILMSAAAAVITRRRVSGQPPGQQPPQLAGRSGSSATQSLAQHHALERRRADALHQPGNRRDESIVRELDRQYPATSSLTPRWITESHPVPSIRRGAAAPVRVTPERPPSMLQSLTDRFRRGVSKRRDQRTPPRQVSVPSVSGLSLDLQDEEQEQHSRWPGDDSAASLQSSRRSASIGSAQRVSPTSRMSPTWSIEVGRARNSDDGDDSDGDDVVGSFSLDGRDSYYVGSCGGSDGRVSRQLSWSSATVGSHSQLLERRASELSAESWRTRQLPSVPATPSSRGLHAACDADAVRDVQESIVPATSTPRMARQSSMLSEPGFVRVQAEAKPGKQGAKVRRRAPGGKKKPRMKPRKESATSAGVNAESSSINSSVQTNAKTGSATSITVSAKKGGTSISSSAKAGGTSGCADPKAEAASISTSVKVAKAGPTSTIIDSSKAGGLDVSTSAKAGTSSISSSAKSNGTGCTRPFQAGSARLPIASGAGLATMAATSAIVVPDAESTGEEGGVLAGSATAVPRKPGRKAVGAAGTGRGGKRPQRAPRPTAATSKQSAAETPGASVPIVKNSKAKRGKPARNRVARNLAGKAGQQPADGERNSAPGHGQTARPLSSSSEPVEPTASRAVEADRQLAQSLATEAAMMRFGKVMNTTEAPRDNKAADTEHVRPAIASAVEAKRKAKPQQEAPAQSGGIIPPPPLPSTRMHFTPVYITRRQPQ